MIEDSGRARPGSGKWIVAAIVGAILVIVAAIAAVMSRPHLPPQREPRYGPTALNPAVPRRPLPTGPVPQEPVPVRAKSHSYARVPHVRTPYAGG